MSMEAPHKKQRAEKDPSRSAIKRALSAGIIAGEILSVPMPAEAAEKIGESTYQDIWEHFEKYEDHAWAKELFDGMVESGIDADFSSAPAKALLFYDKYKQLPRAYGILKKAVPKADGVLASAILQNEQADFTSSQQAELAALVPSNIPFETAVLTHENEPNYNTFRSDPALAYVNAIDRNLLHPLVYKKSMGDADWSAIEKELQLQEVYIGYGGLVPAKMGILHDLSAANGGVDPTQLETAAAIASRDLFMSGIENPTSHDVQAMVATIGHERQRLDSFNAFYGRHIIRVAHGELLKQQDVGPRAAGSVRFGTPALDDELVKQQGGAKTSHTDIVHISPLLKDGASYKTTAESLRSAKAKTLAEFATSLGPLTAYLDGHGGPDAFYLSDGAIAGANIEETSQTQKITFDELAQALQDRYHSQKKHHLPIKESDTVLILSACFMHDFARSLGEDLAARGVPLPTIIVAAEKGQEGFSDFTNPYGSTFNELVVTSPSIGAIIRGEQDIFDTHPNIFVPMEGHPGKLMQISGRATARFDSTMSA